MVNKTCVIGIFGNGKQAKDFLYMFDYIKPDFYIRDEDEEDDGKKYISINEISEIDEKFHIYICKKDSTKAIKQLQEIGLQQGEDFSLAEELFSKLDLGIGDIANGRKVAICGRGAVFSDLIKDKIIRLSDIDVIVDSNASKDDNYLGINVLKLNELLNLNQYVFVVAARNSYREIEGMLLSAGVKKKNIIPYTVLKTNNEMLMRKTYFDDSYGDGLGVCSFAFDYISINEDAITNLCCNGVFLEGAGDLWTNHYAEIWNSTRMKIFRLSILNRSYSFCAEENCPYIQVEKNKKKICNKENKCKKAYPQISVGEYPTAYGIYYDRTCNLYCETCRDKIYIPTSEDIQNRERLLEITKNEIATTSPKFVTVSTGEFFVSKTIQDAVWGTGDYSSSELIILTNGNVFSMDIFKKFKAVYNDVTIAVSIDAGSEETYRRIRRGGDWNILMDNMKVISELRRNGEIKTFYIDFVVQTENVMEMEKFMELGYKYNADYIIFSRLQNWRWTEEEFNAKSVLERDGSIKEKYKKYFTFELLNDRKVSFSNFSSVLGACSEAKPSYYPVIFYDV